MLAISQCFSQFRLILARIALIAISCPVIAQGALKFNILESYPFGYINEDGQKVGTYWEYSEALNRRLDLNLDLKIVPKARVVQHLKLGRVDAAILFRSKKLEPHVQFVSQIREIPIVILSKNSLSIASYDDLRKLKRVGHLRSGSVSEAFDNDTNINKLAINNYPKMLEMLKRDRVSAIVGNGIVLQSLINKECSSYKISISPHILGKKEQWLVLSKQSEFLNMVPSIKEAIKELKEEGVLNQIFEKHLSNYSKKCE